MFRFENPRGKIVALIIAVAFLAFAWLVWPDIVGASGPEIAAPVFVAGKGVGLKAAFPPSDWRVTNIVTLKYMGNGIWRSETNVPGAAYLKISPNTPAGWSLVEPYYQGAVSFWPGMWIIMPTHGQLAILDENYFALWRGEYVFGRGQQMISPFDLVTDGNCLLVVGATVADEVYLDRYTAWSYGVAGSLRRMYYVENSTCCGELVIYPYGDYFGWQSYGLGEVYNRGWHMRRPEPPVWETATPTPTLVPTRPPAPTETLRPTREPAPTETRTSTATPTVTWTIRPPLPTRTSTATPRPTRTMPPLETTIPTPTTAPPLETTIPTPTPR